MGRFPPRIRQQKNTFLSIILILYAAYSGCLYNRGPFHYKLFLS